MEEQPASVPLTDGLPFVTMSIEWRKAVAWVEIPWILVGNLISFVGCLMMTAIGFIKKKKHILIAQCAQFSIQSLGNLALGSVTGFLSCIIGVVRILVFTRFKVTVWLKLGFLALQAALTIWAGADTIIEWIPFLSMVAYTWYLDTDNAVTFKLVNVAGVIMWAVHDFYYRNYVAFSFDVFTIISTAVGILLILRDRKKLGGEKKKKQ